MPPSATMCVCRLSESASKSDVQRNVALGAELLEMIAPAARPAEQHERQIVQRRKSTVGRDVSGSPAALTR